MKFDPLWSRQLHQVVNPRALIICDEYLYTTERNNYLTKIEIPSGEARWSIKIPGAWGWLCSFESNLYYMDQSGVLLVIDKKTGETNCSNKVNSSYPGYVIPSSNFFITGGWRGYSDLACYASSTFEKLWSRNTKSKELIQFSVPYLLNKKQLFTANHSTGKIEIIDIDSGIVDTEIELPKEIDCPDLNRSYQLIDGKITFVTRGGKIYTLNDDFTDLHCEILNVDHVATNLPFFEEDKIIFEDGSGHFVLYSRSKKTTIWKVKIENPFKTNMFACKLSSECHLIAGSSGKLAVVDGDGNKAGYIKPEKRITTNITKQNDLLIYANKSEIKVFRFSPIELV